MQKPTTSYCFNNTKSDCFQLSHVKEYLHKQIDTQIFAKEQKLRKQYNNTKFKQKQRPISKKQLQNNKN
jgi:hypothetical protein